MNEAVIIPQSPIVMHLYLDDTNVHAKVTLSQCDGYIQYCYIPSWKPPAGNFLVISVYILCDI